MSAPGRVTREELVAMLRELEFVPWGQPEESCPICDAAGHRNESHEERCRLGQLLARLDAEDAPEGDE